MKKPNKARSSKLISAPLLGLAILLQCSFVPCHQPYIPVTFNLRGTTSHTHRKYQKVLQFFHSDNSMELYDSLHLEELGLSKMVFRMAVKGMEKLSHAGRLKGNVISIIDFSQPSTNKRLYVIDLDNNELLYNTWVAHGMKSGKNHGKTVFQ